MLQGSVALIRQGQESKPFGSHAAALLLITLFLLFPAVFPLPLTVVLSLGCLALGGYG